MVKVLSDVQSILLVNNCVSLARILILSRKSVPPMLSFLKTGQQNPKNSYFQVLEEEKEVVSIPHLLLH